MNQKITTKTQEAAFALLRVSAYIRRFELRKRFEVLSYNLIENVAYKNPEMSLLTITGLRNFLSLARQLYEVEINNAKIIDRELEILENEINRFAGSPEQVDLQSLFSQPVSIKNPAIAPTKQKGSFKKDAQTVQIHKIDGVVIKDSEVGVEAIEYGNDNAAIESGNSEDQGAAIRQSRIAALIAGSVDSRLPLKSIIAAFPGVSERTLRYDLKSLFEQGRVRRQGSGGPSNFYELITPNSGVINL